MAQAETGSSRLPRGTKPVVQAFFTALDTLPDAQRTAVARAAQTTIRDELKTRRDKAKGAAGKVKARATAKRVTKPAMKMKRATKATAKSATAVVTEPVRRGPKAKAA